MTTTGSVLTPTLVSLVTGGERLRVGVGIAEVGGVVDVETTSDFSE